MFPLFLRICTKDWNWKKKYWSKYIGKFEIKSLFAPYRTPVSHSIVLFAFDCWNVHSHIAITILSIITHTINLLNQKTGKRLITNHFVIFPIFPFSRGNRHSLIEIVMKGGKGLRWSPLYVIGVLGCNILLLSIISLVSRVVDFFDLLCSHCYI